ncbi:hypothetical protein EV360DRAFT_76599 [Lentinula raphanica]|nr:hypothetical protein EV360DRAFT_76599 [Lentinula raphanica]
MATRWVISRPRLLLLHVTQFSIIFIHWILLGCKCKELGEARGCSVMRRTQCLSIHLSREVGNKFAAGLSTTWIAPIHIRKSTLGLGKLRLAQAFSGKFKVFKLLRFWGVSLGSLGTRHLELNWASSESNDATARKKKVTALYSCDGISEQACQ